MPELHESLKRPQPGKTTFRPLTVSLAYITGAGSGWRRSQQFLQEAPTTVP